MSNEETFMTQTIQSSLWASLNEAGKDLNQDKSEAEDNVSLLLSVFDSLNNLYATLSRLDYLIKRKNMEQNMKRERQG
ncbi:MAG: hypothetical protein LBB81_02010 [Treponema sp.]|jgi:UTP:GlnB (protein PII) uridylyltransferase|nr:hypothetical protein [Treponema sp.]